MRLYALAHVGDGALGCHAEDLREAKAVIACTSVAAPAASASGNEQIGAVLSDDFVDEPLRRGRQHQAREPADEHQPQAETEPAAVRPHELAGFAPRGRGRHPFSSSDSMAWADCTAVPLRRSPLWHHPKVQVRHTIT